MDKTTERAIRTGKPRVDPDKEAEKRINELETTLAEVNAALLRTVDEKTKLEAQLSAQQPPQDSELAQTQEIQRLEGELRKAADYINALIRRLLNSNSSKKTCKAKYRCK